MRVLFQSEKANMIRMSEVIEKRSTVRIARRERGIWQRRFWEHVIRDQHDYTAEYTSLLSPYKLRLTDQKRGLYSPPPLF